MQQKTSQCDSGMEVSPSRTNPTDATSDAEALDLSDLLELDNSNANNEERDFDSIPTFDLSDMSDEDSEDDWQTEEEEEDADYIPLEDSFQTELLEESGLSDQDSGLINQSDSSVIQDRSMGTDLSGTYFKVK